MFTGPKLAVYATLGCALIALGTSLFLWGAQSQKTVAAKQAAEQASRVIHEKTKNDSELRAMPQADLCREINQGVDC